jgi:hypothetical protein
VCPLPPSPHSAEQSVLPPSLLCTGPSIHCRLQSPALSSSTAILFVALERVCVCVEGGGTRGHVVVTVVRTRSGGPCGGVLCLWRSERRMALDLAFERGCGEVKVEEREVIIHRSGQQFALQWCCASCVSL